MQISYKPFIGCMISIVVIFTISCKQVNSDSSLKTLDEFTGMSTGTNHCHGGKTVSSVAKSRFINNSSENLWNSVQKALTAVPEEIQKVFFGAGGKIVVDNARAQAVCESAVNGQEVVQKIYAGSTSSLYACWAFESKNSSKPVIYLQAHKDVIEHSLLRVFAYFYSQAVIPVAERSQKLYSVAQNFDSLSKELKSAFLLDLENLAKNGKIDSSRYEDIKALPQDTLKQYIFAESFDSFHCNEKTQKSMRKNFPNTFAAFNSSAN